MYAYLNSASDVIGLSSTSRTLEQAQAQDANITSIISNAPTELIAVVYIRQNGIPAYFHRHTSGDGSDISHYTQQLYLIDLKSYCCNKIDIRTSELREVGWENPESSGNFYSLSTQAEMKLTKAYLRRDDVGFPYPFRLPDLDNSAILDLVDAAAIDTAHARMFEVLNDLVESGLALKKQIVDATTVAAVLAVTDSR